MNNDKYLPMGTVVLLRKGSKKIMIFGRKQVKMDTGEQFDYIAHLYPEGNIKKDMAILFNHDDIREVVHLGYVDEDEELFQRAFLQTGRVADVEDILHTKK